MPTETQKAEAAWLSAFGESTRLAAICHLARGEMTVTKLAAQCDVEMVNLSVHLGVLRDCGLVTAVRDGRFVRYSLAGAKINGNTLTFTHPSGIQVTVAFD